MGRPARPAVPPESRLAGYRKQSLDELEKDIEKKEAEKPAADKELSSQEIFKKLEELSKEGEKKE
jgi:hypothetical protein